MRNPGTVYRKLREAKYKHLILLYRKFLKISPENCKYNQIYKFTGEDRHVHFIRLCMLHQPDDGTVTPHLLDVCQEQNHCKNCNAFVARYSREDIKNMFNEELNDKKIRSIKYPDICALEWVLEKSVPGIPPITWIQKLYISLKISILKNRIL